ncbi:MAG: hypothetical protein ACJ71Z_04900 [Aeromicrobium sp.]
MATHKASGTSLSAPFEPEREPTKEEVEQLEKERAERLDPNNRPRNAQVDNTKRHWIGEKEDFEDNLEGHPPEWDKGDGAGTKVDPEIWQRIEKQTGKPVERLHQHRG